MNAVLEAVLALGYGVVSAAVPLVSAEAYAVVAGHRGHAVVAVAGLALGQTAGKLLLFESARRGSGRLIRRARTGRLAAWITRWSGPIRRWLSRRRTGLPTVLVSAAVGVPPLAAVSLAAGTTNLRHWEFATMCLLGRLIRFAVLALALTLA